MNRLLYALQFVFVAAIQLLLLSCSDKRPYENLKEGFLNPPDTARPGVYWYFMDGNLDRQGMTKDLESMKKAGIGYVLFLEVNVGVPRGKVDFLSAEWQELFAHAVSEAERLGIRVIMGSGPGWAGSGGPWVRPEQSMVHLVGYDTTVTGPGEFSCVPGIPKPRKPFFGEGSLTPSLRKIRNDWYEDVAVLAFQSLQTRSLIERIDEKALYYRAPFTSQRGVSPYLTLPADEKDDPGSVIAAETVTDITKNLQPDGTLNWSIPPGRWTILRLGMRNNGAVTRPAPAPGLGFECDKFDTASFNAHYNEYIGKLLKKTGPNNTKKTGGWKMIHIDSWEMGSQNWSPNFRQEFIRRRGYDPLKYLPVYTGMIVESREMSERFLWDVRQTSNELIVENHARHFRDLGRRSGFRLSIEPYDMDPAADLDLGSVADVPMCEFWSDGFGFNSSFSCIESTSLAHVAGKPIVAAEAFTADSPEAWKQYPGSMKNQGDWAFCMGINRLIYHTFAHQPLPDKYRPGMTMGPYGVHWDRNQTWWPMADGYHAYITRCQFVLSQGKAVADILYLTPEGAPQVFIPPASALEGTGNMPDRRGYSFDGCSPSFLLANASVRDGKIIFPGGASYEMMVLPSVARMTPELLGRIDSLVRSGATIMGNPPVKSPSLSGFPGCDEKVSELVTRIWGSGNVPRGLVSRNPGSGTVWWGQDLASDIPATDNGSGDPGLYPRYELSSGILKEMGIRPDFHASGNIRYTHRVLPDCDVYFISNRTNSLVNDTCYFRSSGSSAGIWNAVAGTTGKIACVPGDGGTSGVPVKLDAYQSFFIVFDKEPGKKPESDQDAGALEEKTVINELNGMWDIAFDTAAGSPAATITGELFDWSESAEDGIRFYSGIATYSKEFDLPGERKLNNDLNYCLDLGTVKNIGRVRLNGIDLGVVWTAPYQVDVTGIIRQKHNYLEIDVANLWANRLIGDEKEPWDGISDGKWPAWLLEGRKRETRRITFTTHRFYKKDDPLSGSGLIGPVTVKAVKRLQGP